MTAEIVNLNAVETKSDEEWGGLDALAAFDKFMEIYPRCEGHGRARQQWIWALAKVANDYRVILAGAKSCRVYHLAEKTPYNFIALPHRWLLDEGWRSTYKLPPTPVASPQEQQKAMREMMERKAAEGSRFARDWLKRQ